MASSQPPEETQDIHEQLVAYLDGELDAETARRMDDLLSTDPIVRKDVAELDATWNLLDHLPRNGELGENFTRSTLELVAQKAEKDLQERFAKESGKLRLAAMAMIGSMFLAGLLGVVVTDLIVPGTNDDLVEHLDAIDQIDPLEQVHDVQFLHELRKTNLFVEPPEPPEDALNENDSDSGDTGTGENSAENAETKASGLEEQSSAPGSNPPSRGDDPGENNQDVSVR